MKSKKKKKNGSSQQNGNRDIDKETKQVVARFNEDGRRREIVE